jgi:hypothetical protein
VHSLDGMYFLCRYSSWSPKLPRPRVFSVKGGGKFLVWQDTGILIDPGFNLLENLYAEGFSLEDVDVVIITHDHLDHTDDFESLWRLVKEHNEVILHGDFSPEEQKERLIELTLFTNQGFKEKCSRFLSADPKKSYVKYIHPLSRRSHLSPEGLPFDITVIEAKHKEDLTSEYSIGFVLELKDRKNSTDNDNDNDNPAVFKIGFTSDTRFHKKIETLYDTDIIVANISNATFRELKTQLKFDEFPMSKEYEDFFDILSKPSQEQRDVISVLKWSFWYGRDGENWANNFTRRENEVSIQIEDYSGDEQLPRELASLLKLKQDNFLVCDDIINHGVAILEPKNKELLYDWAERNDINKITIKKFLYNIENRSYPGVLNGHLGASGVYEIWDGLSKKVQANNTSKLLILSEFREEMGSFRNKVALLLNNEFEELGRSLNVNNGGNLCCFSSDIGMAVKFVTSQSQHNRQSKIQCSVCSHDNDLYIPIINTGFNANPFPEETFHSPQKITEVCIKGESEGIFYLCENHNTGPKSLFMERINRFDLFKEGEIPL